jgi:hypothetical protein
MERQALAERGNEAGEGRGQGRLSIGSIGGRTEDGEYVNSQRREGGAVKGVALDTSRARGALCLIMPNDVEHATCCEEKLGRGQ